MKIQITENQLNRLRQSLNEVNTAMDNLNNMINVDDFTFTKEIPLVITFDKVMIEGSIKDDDLHVMASIDKVKHDNKDVTNFALNWAIRDQWTSEDLPLGMLLCINIAEILNKNYLSLIGGEVTEYDVTIE